MSWKEFELNPNAKLVNSLDKHSRMIKNLCEMLRSSLKRCNFTAVGTAETSIFVHAKLQEDISTPKFAHAKLQENISTSKFVHAKLQEDISTPKFDDAKLQEDISTPKLGLQERQEYKSIKQQFKD